VVVRGHATTLTADGWKVVQETTTADVNGIYTIQFSVDLSPIYWGGVFIADSEGDDLILWNHEAYLKVNQTHNFVNGLGPIPPAHSDGVPITLTLASTSTQFVNEMDWGGFFEFNNDTHGNFPDIVPGEIVTAEVDGYSWQGVVPVDVITATPDVDNDWITGEISEPTDQVQVAGSQWGWDWVPQLYPIAGTFDTVTTANSPYTATPPGFDIRNAVIFDVGHYVAGDAINEVSGGADYLRIWPNYNGTVGSISPPGTAFTITLKGGGGSTKAVIDGTSHEPTGSIGWMNFNETGEQIEYGDIIEVQAENGFNQVIDIPNFDIQLDLGADSISGNVLPNVLLYVEVGDQGHGFVPTQANGDFAISVSEFQEFWGDGDLVWGNWAQVCYATEAGNHICVDKNWPSITARYTNMGWNDVFGDSAIPGNTILITVTDEASAQVATGETTAGDCDWCGPQEYNYEFPFGTIISGNRVTVDFGDDLIDFVEVVSITGYADMDTDIITVTVPPSSTINVYGENRWWDMGPEWNDVQVDASGVASFDFGAEGWDIQPGDYFHVYVPDGHNNQTEYIFNIPYAQLQIQKENTSGHTMPGYSILYRIQYWNDGNGDAENTIITDSIPSPPPI
jgi:hypothetical protein